jgi:antitoxin HigA-1
MISGGWSLNGIMEVHIMSQSSIISKLALLDQGAVSVRCHPGEVLREEFMVPLGPSANKLALALRVLAGRISDIVNEKRAISPDTSLRLSRYFGTSPGLRLNLQSDYDLRLALENRGAEIERHVTPLAVSKAA